MNKLLPILIVLAFPWAHAFAAPSVLFDKTSVSVPQNSTFTVTVNVNADAYTAQSSKVTIKYASVDLDVVQVANGNFFPSFTQANDTTNGLLEITGYTTAIGGGSTAGGPLATITFKAKINSGSDAVTFGCNGAGHDTNILTASGQNIFSSCTPVNTLGVAYTGVDAPANTPTPTLAAGVTPTPTPVQNTNPSTVCTGLSSDISSATGTPLAVTFTCSGTYPNGYIRAAYFNFGDGTNDTIVQNAGSPGSISTTHTYTTIGSLGASCKVENNDLTWSSVPAVCSKIIYIKPRPTAAAATQAPSAAIPTPTPVIMTLAYVTPTAIPTPVLTPLPIVTAPTQSSTSPGWLIGSAVVLILIGGIAYVLSKRKPPPPPTTTPPPIYS